MEKLYKFQGLRETFQVLLIDITETNIQEIACDSISEICKRLDTHEGLSVSPAFYFMETYLTNYLEYALENKGFHIVMFFTSLSGILRETTVHHILERIKPIEGLVSWLAKLIM